MFKRGFTLIELLVVVSIVGLLASIVLTSLASARMKGRDAARVAALHEMGKQIALYDADPANVFWTTVNGATQCTVAYSDVGGCLGIGRSGASIATGFNSYKDPVTPGTTCKGVASGASSTAPCQYSISNASGAATPTSQSYEICIYLENGAGSLPKGLVMVTSAAGGGVIPGCN
jgi:prepilin-type N-terminal cleavage/methylation domain-containing protein